MAKPPNRVNPLPRPPHEGKGKRMAGNDKSREERLAEALRENLRKRKAQSREMQGNVTSDDAESPPQR
jgi:hypothetical protein